MGTGCRSAHEGTGSHTGTGWRTGLWDGEGEGARNMHGDGLKGVVRGKVRNAGRRRL